MKIQNDAINVAYIKEYLYTHNGDRIGIPMKCYSIKELEKEDIHNWKLRNIKTE